MNKHKDMQFYGIWLTKAEEISLKESLKNLNHELKRQFAINNIVDIMETANERGDLNRR
jgi:hypothetical protein